MLVPLDGFLTFHHGVPHASRLMPSQCAGWRTTSHTVLFWLLYSLSYVIETYKKTFIEGTLYSYKHSYRKIYKYRSPLRKHITKIQNQDFS